MFGKSFTQQKTLAVDEVYGVQYALAASQKRFHRRWHKDTGAK